MTKNPLSDRLRRLADAITFDDRSLCPEIDFGAEPEMITADEIRIAADALDKAEAKLENLRKALEKIVRGIDVDPLYVAFQALAALDET